MAIDCLLCRTRLTPDQMMFCSVTCRDDYKIRLGAFYKRYSHRVNEYHRELNERLDRALFDINRL